MSRCQHPNWVECDKSCVPPATARHGEPADTEITRLTAALSEARRERDAAVKRAEEAERSADILQNAHRGTLTASVRASREAEAAKRRLALAERVVEELEDMASHYGCDCGHPACKRCAMARSARAAVAAYRKG